MSANYIDVLCDFVEKPRRAAASVSEFRPTGLGVLCFVIAGLSLFLSRSVLGRMLFPLGPVYLALYCLWVILSGFALTGVIHLLMEMMGGRGSAAGLFVLFGLSDLVLTLLLPGALLVRLLSPSLDIASFSLFAAMSIVVMALRARSIRDNYGVSSMKAWFVLLLPYLGVALIIVGVFTLAIVGAAASLIRFLS